jgi:hypothetical protein
MMFRTVVPDSPPTICFPFGGSLKIGTLRSYDVGSIWDERASFESDGTFRVSGRVIGGTKRVEMESSRNDDVDTSGGMLVKLIGKNDSTLGGLSAGLDGTILTVLNPGDAAIPLVNESAGSSPENRLSVSPDLTIAAKTARNFVYDGDARRWFPVI